MTGAECLLRTLLANEVNVCFMNPGTSEMQFVAALDRVPGMRGVLCLFEGVCAGAADGYARMTRKPAATLLHLGPGLANGLANFHNARKAKSPVVSIVGEHTTGHLRYDAPLTSNIEAFAKTVTSEVRVVSSAAEIGSLASDAVAGAVRPPGRVSMLIVPADLSWSESGAPGKRIAPPVRRIPDTQRVANMAEFLRHGAATALLIGGTALNSRALDCAGRIAAATGVRVFADRNASRTESGRGRFQPPRIAYFPESALAMLSGLKYLILVEAKPPVSFFGYPDTPSYLAPMDCEVYPLAGREEDGTSALEALMVECCAATAKPVLQEQRASADFSSGPLRLDSLAQVISAYLPEHAIVADEMVSASAAVCHHLLSAAPHDYLPVTGGSIGQGLPVAVGAAIACPNRKVVALEGDGSGMYTPQSLWTMARESLDVVTVIFANRRYRILDVEMRRTGANGFGPAASGMIDIGRPDLDWVKLSESMGVPAARAATVEQFARQFQLAIQEKGPQLIEAVL